MESPARACTARSQRRPSASPRRRGASRRRASRRSEGGGRRQFCFHEQGAGSACSIRANPGRPFGRGGEDPRRSPRSTSDAAGNSSVAAARVNWNRASTRPVRAAPPAEKQEPGRVSRAQCRWRSTGEAPSKTDRTSAFSGTISILATATRRLVLVPCGRELDGQRCSSCAWRSGTRALRRSDRRDFQLSQAWVTRAACDTGRDPLSQPCSCLQARPRLRPPGFPAHGGLRAGRDDLAGPARPCGDGAGSRSAGARLRTASARVTVLATGTASADYG